MIIFRHTIVNYLLTRGHRAMCIWPFIFLRPGTDISVSSAVLNHERIHARQQLEMLWLFFFLWYGIEYLMRLIRHRNHFKAYHALSHEREAYENETDIEYLNNRNAFAWLRYI
ncbi:MAG: hypothetical protein JXB19_01045 [Bacteroidales bacterium]|nr:hypothetical protein [Bacteroidales bacterium]